MTQLDIYIFGIAGSVIVVILLGSKILKLFCSKKWCVRPKIVLDKEDTMWVYAGSTDVITSRIYAPNHYYFRPIKYQFKWFIITGDIILCDIDNFHIPLGEQNEKT